MNNSTAQHDVKEPPFVNGGMFVKYFTCPHWLYFDIYGNPEKKSNRSAFHEMLLERGLLHEEKTLQGLEYVSVSAGDYEQRFKETVELMKNGVERIYHGVLMADDMIGEPDLLERNNERSSKFGAYYYEAVDIKSSERLSEGMRMQVSFYSDLLERVQGTRPGSGYILNVSGHRIGFSIKESRELYERILSQIKAVLAGEKPAPRVSSGCRQSPWFHECIAFAEETDDLTLLYNIKTKTQNELRAMGIRTINDVANMDAEQVHRMSPDIKLKTLNRAKLQAEALLNKSHYIRNDIKLPEVGFELFFDIESDPLRAVDYLFGFLVRDGAGERYEYQIAESPEGEADMWRNFLEWIELLPSEYAVYHFGTFEKARLSALEFKYGSTDALNTFKQRLIDLNEIVKDKVVFPLYFYGIKDIGRYIGFERNGDISGGGESVAVYEKWLETGDKSELQKIIDYNKDDVIATRKLKDWLIEENEKRFGDN